jgi:hypothetical protein
MAESGRYHQSRLAGSVFAIYISSLCEERSDKVGVSFRSSTQE